MKKLLIAILLTACATDPAVRRQQILLNAATVVDMETTFAALDRCGGACREANPILTAPVDRGRLLTYAIQFALNAFVIRMAERSKDKPGSFWKYMPHALIGGHAIAGALTVRFLLEPASSEDGAARAWREADACPDR